MGCLGKLIHLLCLGGLLVSGLALYVEYRKGYDPDYVALCDINESVSCSDVLTSSYSKGFGIIGSLLKDPKHPLNQPNPVYGLGFYLLIMALSCCSSRSDIVATLRLYLVFISNLMSLYLAYLLYFVLEKACVLCISSYVVNFLLLITCYFHGRSMRQSRKNPDDVYKYQKQSKEPQLPFDFKKNI